MRIENLTPHALSVHGQGGVVTVPSSGTVCRVAVEYRHIGYVQEQTCTYQNDFPVDIPIYRADYGEVVGLPAPQDGVIYVVSGLVAGQVSRADVYSPGELIRDATGKPVGCDGLKMSGGVK